MKLTPICANELGLLTEVTDEFLRRNNKFIGDSVELVSDPKKFCAFVKKVSGHNGSYLMVGILKTKVAKLFGISPAVPCDNYFTSTA